MVGLLTSGRSATTRPLSLSLWSSGPSPAHFSWSGLMFPVPQVRFVLTIVCRAPGVGSSGGLCTWTLQCAKNGSTVGRGVEFGRPHRSSGRCCELGLPDRCVCGALLGVRLASRQWLPRERRQLHKRREMSWAAAPPVPSCCSIDEHDQALAKFFPPAWAEAAPLQQTPLRKPWITPGCWSAITWNGGSCVRSGSDVEIISRSISFRSWNGVGDRLEGSQWAHGAVRADARPKRAVKTSSQEFV